jgi:tRNA A-37 threonylcarbamoyl transferase component Bud32
VKGSGTACHFTCTMTLQMEHPDAATLQAYLHGRLDPAEAAKLDSHLESCEVCGVKLGEVEADTFSDLLRLPATQAFTSTMGEFRPDLPVELRSHGRYQVQDRIGRGGMGVVYRAVHRMMNRPVALKIIRPEYLASPQAVERFRREVRAAAQLSHANIVAAYDAEEVGGLHFLVMEFVNGKTLDAIVAKRGKLEVPAACHLARQVALGLDHAHSRGMVHRDIKPQNLILADRSKVKILDFGLALSRAEDTTESATREGIMLGTLIYSAPEQRRSAATVDARADLYSLGATLAFLLIGDHPLDAPNWPDHIPAELRAILTKLMAERPEERFPTAKAVAEALTPFCTTKPPVVEAEIVEEPVRSRRWPVILASAAALLAVAFGIWAMTRKPKVEPGPTPTKDEPAPSAEWASLLGFDPAKAAVGGRWRMTPEGLHVSPTEAARLAIPATVPAEYDLRVEFTRHTGENSIGVIGVMNGRQFVFELDAWTQHLGGFQNIAGLTLRDNPTRRTNMILNNGRRYTMLVEVRRGSIRGLLDGIEIARHATDGSDLSVNEEWPMPSQSGLGLVAWKSGTTFHRVEIAKR